LKTLEKETFLWLLRVFRNKLAVTNYPKAQELLQIR